jgi:hypothetical protein
VFPAHREPTVYCDYLVMGFSIKENAVAFNDVVYNICLIECHIKINPPIIPLATSGIAY